MSSTEFASDSARASHEMMRSAARAAVDSPSKSTYSSSSVPPSPAVEPEETNASSELVSSVRAGHESIRSAALHSVAASDGVVAASLDIAADLSALQTLSRVLSERPSSSASGADTEPEIIVPSDSARAGHESIRSAARAAVQTDAVGSASQELDRDVEYCAHAALRSAARSILSLGTVLQSEPVDGPPVDAPHAAVRSVAASILTLDSVVDAELGSLSPSKAGARALVSPPKKTMTPKPRKPSSAVQPEVKPSTLIFEAAGASGVDSEDATSPIDLRAPLLCVGSLNVDLITYLPRFPGPGETLMGKTFQQGPGGKGANQACAAALLSARGCIMVGAVGDDALGADYLRVGGSFLQAGVDVSSVLVREGVSTGVAPIWVDANGENSIVVVAGANATLTAGDVDDAMRRADAYSGVLVQLEVPLEATVAALRGAAAARVPSYFTPAPAPPAGLPDDVLALASVLIPNRGELFSLSATESDDTLLERVASLQARGANSVVVTLGAEGALVVGAGGQSALVRAPRVTAVDTSGAGDAFSGSLAFFATALTRSTDDASAEGGGEGTASGGAAVPVPFDVLVEAARRAVYVAAQTVTKKGTQSSYARREDLLQDLFNSDLGFVPTDRRADGIDALTVVAAPVVVASDAAVSALALAPVVSTPLPAVMPRNAALSTDLDWVRPEAGRQTPRSVKDDKSNC